MKKDIEIILGYIVKDAPNCFFDPIFKEDKYFEFFDNGESKYCSRYFFERGFNVYKIISTDYKNCDIAVVDREYCFFTEYGTFFDEAIEAAKHFNKTVEYGKLLRYLGDVKK